MDYIMRKLIVAALALSPMMLHAQAHSPAPTQTSALVRPNDLRAGNAATPTVAPLRISTGVKSPKLLSTVSIVEPVQNINTIDRLAVVSMIVDANGKPSDLKIVRSAGLLFDANVLSAVGQYRFTPGTLNNEPTAIPVTLEITLHHSGL
jgi:TonB family protein